MNDLVKYIPKFIYAIYKQRDDLQKIFPIKEEWGILSFFLWWKENGEIKEYNLFWLPSKKLKELFYFSKDENGIFNIHLSIAFNNIELDFCKSFLEKKDLESKAYKQYITWINNSYKTYFKNTFFIFPNLPGLKDISLKEDKILFDSNYQNNFKESYYLSILLIYLKINYKDSKYAKYLYELLKIRGKEIDAKKLPAIFRFYYKNLKNYSQKNDTNQIYNKYLNKPTSRKLPRFIYEIFNSRIDLKDQFKIQIFSLEIFLLKWWIESGSKEYSFYWDANNLLNQITCSSNDLINLDSSIKAKSNKNNLKKIPKFIIEIFNSRIDLKNAFLKQNFNLEIFLLRWWIESGSKEYNLTWIGTDFKKLSDFILFDSENKDLLKNKKFSDYESKYELIENFIFSAPLQRRKINIKKTKKINSKESISDDKFFTNKLFARRKISRKNLSDIDDKEFSDAKISITGFHNFQLGISEDSRNIYKSIHSMTPNVKACNIPLVNFNKKIKINYKVFEFIKSEKNIIVLPPQEQLNLFMNNPLFYESKKIYALIPWELENVPKYLECIFDKFDTILAPSKYIERAFSSIHKNVRLLPHYVDINLEINVKRFKKFTFIYSADLNSFIARKNPICVIKAYKNLIKEKFTKNKNKPHLFLRLSNFSNTKHHEIIREINNFEGINLITENLSRKKYLELLSKSHCYISCHRAEGFGRNIAEAMYLGTPTIVSNYSGNLDFCNEENSYLIDGELIEVNKDDYPLSEGCLWYNPSNNHLKNIMFEVFNNYDKAELKCIRAKNLIKTNHSIKNYIENLNNII